MQRDALVAGLGLTCIFLSFGIAIFLFQHLKMIRMNRTTNEMIKTARLEYSIRNQIVFFKSFIRRTETQSDGQLPKVRLDG